MANPAIPADVAARWRPLSTDEETVAYTLLSDAWRMLGRDYKAATGTTLDAAMVADPTLTPDVVQIIAQAVIRVLRNPDGLQQEQIDDYSYTRDTKAASGTLYIDPDELAALIGMPDTKGRAFSINLIADYDSRWP